LKYFKFVSFFTSRYTFNLLMTVEMKQEE